MTDYLDRLESELVRAGFHQRRLPIAPIAAALAVILVASWSIYRPVGDERERVAEPTNQVDVSLDTVIVESPPPVVRLGFTVREPATYVVETGGAVESGRVAVGHRYVNLDVPEKAAEVKVTLTDDDGNERVFTQPISSASPADPPLGASFGVVRDSNRVPAASVSPGFPARLGPDPEAFDVGELGGGLSAKLGVGEDSVCVSVRAAADGGGVACWPINELLTYGVSGRANGISIALVPDGILTASASLLGGGQETLEVVDNVAATTSDAAFISFPVP